MSIGCCWPPSDEPPAAPLRVDAGAPQTADVGEAITLDGSASGGTPPYDFLWSQVSGPGTATFVDASDPATDVSFDVAGVYVLKLIADDDDGSVAGDQVTETITQPPVFLLDTLEAQPLWGHHIGVQLRTGQTNVFRARRSQDDVEQDFTVADLVDIEAALNAFAGSGIAYLVTVYNAVAASPFVSITETDPLKQVVIYAADDGGAIFGAKGFLAGRFLGNGTRYRRADALGLSGAPAFTIVNDLNGDTDAYGGCVGLGANYATQKTIVLTIDYGSAGSAVEADQGDTNYNVIYNLPPAAFTAGWAQLTAAASALLSAYAARWQGVPLLVNDVFGVDGAATLEDNQFTWGSTPDGAFSIAGLMSSAFVWGSQLSVGDQAKVDAFELASHA